MTVTFRDIGMKVAAGQRLDRADTDIVVETEDLIELGALADDRRRHRHADRVTFVRVQEIDVTSIQSLDVEIVAAAGVIRITGELRGYDDARRAVRAVASVAGSVPVSGFSLDALAELSGWRAQALLDIVGGLKEEGLSLITEVRAERLPGPEWLDVVGRSELMIERVTVGDVSEHGGTDLIRRVASWGGALTPVYAFAPLARVLRNPPTTGYEDLRQVALARLLVDNIQSIQVDWSLYGPKLAQVALMFGADDVDTVSPMDVQDRGRRRTTIEEIVGNIRASGLEPVQRNGRFESFTE